MSGGKAQLVHIWRHCAKSFRNIEKCLPCIKTFSVIDSTIAFLLFSCTLENNARIIYKLALLWLLPYCSLKQNKK